MTAIMNEKMNEKLKKGKRRKRKRNEIKVDKLSANVFV